MDNNTVTLAQATHVPTRTTMVLIVSGDRNPVYLRHLGFSTVIGGRHFNTSRADLRFLSKQEEKRFNCMAANTADWSDLSFYEGDDAKYEALGLARAAANPVVAQVIRNLFG